MGNKFENYPNYQFFKNNMHEKYSTEDSNKNAMFQVQQIISKNSLSPVIEFKLPFPYKYPALELIESATSINDISTYILKDIVFISGFIHKRISYVSFEESYSSVKTDFKTVNTLGCVKVLCADIPFECYTKVPHIQPKDKIDIDSAATDTSNILDLLDTPVHLAQNKVTLYKNLREKLIINIHFSVLRLIQRDL